MESFSVRELTSSDAQTLLAFEVENRAWFESNIDARDPAFYSLQGVCEHIDGCMSDFAIGVWHPFVIQDASGKMVGRANLKNINLPKGFAEVGYRIAQNAAGKGLATLALRRLIQEAHVRWNLTQLVAYVYAENVGSRKVLERCGFLHEQPEDGGNVGNTWRFVLSI
jgi:ribosomal-protein-alanine N-acetyltransferase